MPKKKNYKKINQNIAVLKQSNALTNVDIVALKFVLRWPIDHFTICNLF